MTVATVFKVFAKLFVQLFVQEQKTHLLPDFLCFLKDNIRNIMGRLFLFCVLAISFIFFVYQNKGVVVGTWAPILVISFLVAHNAKWKKGIARNTCQYFIPFSSSTSWLSLLPGPGLEFFLL